LLQAGRTQVWFPMRPVDSSTDLIFPADLWPWGRLSLQQKWVPGIFLRVKGGWRVGWPHRHLCADFLENVGASTSHKPMGLHGLLQGYLYLIIIIITFYSPSDITLVSPMFNHRLYQSNKNVMKGYSWRTKNQRTMRHIPSPTALWTLLGMLAFTLKSCGLFGATPVAAWSHCANLTFFCILLLYATSVFSVIEKATSITYFLGSTVLCSFTSWWCSVQATSVPLTFRNAFSCTHTEWDWRTALQQYLMMHLFNSIFMPGFVLYSKSCSLE
jgi:hypothetical protein